MSKERNTVIFGAGQFGRQALTKNRSDTLFFVDNNSTLWGTTVDGIPVRPVESLLNEPKRRVIIASRQSDSMEAQLISMGITKYEYFNDDPRGYFMIEDLVFNPYVDGGRINSGDKEINDTAWKLKEKAVNERVDGLYRSIKLFDHIEIETINRCNGVCEFCPVSVGNDNREYHIMTDALFEKIIDELAQLDYDGKLALFSNNEPFLDPKIISRHRYAREKIPKARMHLFTNGTLLTVEKFVEIIGFLDELIIDNYDQGLKLIPSCERIVDYCLQHSELTKKVTIVLRKPREVLSSRGGDSPNKKNANYCRDVKCVLPFKQMIIRPDGKVSLCCNDPLGRDTMGDVSKDSLEHIWFGDKFTLVRDCIYRGRKNWHHCLNCDALSLQ